MSDFIHLSCPVCQKPLQRRDNSLLCSSGHGFDIAGKGYVNLLLSQDKHSKDPGDNKEMAQSRKRFLDKGYYRPLAEGLCNVFGLLLGNHSSVLLDAGCGDGYYTHTLHNALKESGRDFIIYGMDISKEAIRLAAGRNKEIAFLVASLFKLPLPDQTVEGILNVFAPACDNEFSRVLKKDGRLVTVIPGKNHLIELKSVLYDKPYVNDEKGPELPSFVSEDQVHITNIVEIQTSSDLMDLFTMTPYYWKTPKEGLERLNKLTNLKITTDFIIGIHKKT